MNRPDYINYAITGSTLGHELTHAFDNNGKRYDAFGKNKDWVSIYTFNNLLLIILYCSKILNFLYY